MRAHVSRRQRADEGFTLVELLIVVAAMPLVVGALAVAMISVFSLYPSVSNRLTDSADSQIVGLNFQTDVQSASLITTDSSVTSPAPCGTGYQVLGLQLANGTEISYDGSAAPGTTPTSYQLMRDVCTNGNETQSTVLAHDLPASILQPTSSPITITCSQTNPPTTCNLLPPNNTPAYQNGWQSTVGVTSVAFKTIAPASNYTYEFEAVPAPSSNSTNLATPTTPSTGCGLATAGTGTYASTLCFVDFTPWNASPQVQAAGVSCPANLPSPASPWLAMSANVGNTPFTLSFCMSVSATVGGGAITGPTSAGASCGVAARNGSYDITAVPLPTYACPPGSEAYLGNNGFYTGVAGSPGLYEVDQGSTATIQFANVQVLGANGQAASNWELVTGDAESTDSGESIIWSSNQKLNLLQNTPLSPVGNACNSTPPSYNTSSLTGVGTTTVECANSPSEDHTGTPMLEAAAPSSLTVTLNGGGLQATFLGVLLP